MTIEVRCGMGWMPDGRPGDLRPATVEEYVAEIERLRAETAMLRNFLTGIQSSANLALADHQQSPNQEQK